MLSLSRKPGLPRPGEGKSTLDTYLEKVGKLCFSGGGEHLNVKLAALLKSPLTIREGPRMQSGRGCLCLVGAACPW